MPHVFHIVHDAMCIQWSVGMRMIEPAFIVYSVSFRPHGMYLRDVTVVEKGDVYRYCDTLIVELILWMCSTAVGHWASGSESTRETQRSGKIFVISFWGTYIYIFQEKIFIFFRGKLLIFFQGGEYIYFSEQKNTDVFSGRNI